MEYLIILLFFMVYFLPSYIAHRSGKKNNIAIFVVNLFFGWTVIGWFTVLIWSLLKD